MKTLLKISIKIAVNGFVVNFRKSLFSRSENYVAYSLEELNRLIQKKLEEVKGEQSIKVK